MFISKSHQYLQEHEKERVDVMEKILKQLKDDFVLKGGTALLFGYGLDRFSEDIDLDAINWRNQLKNKILNLKVEGYDLNITVKKDTETTFRAMIDYGAKRQDLPEGFNEYKLKLEVSLRNKGVSNKDYIDKEGIRIYRIENLISQKINAFGGRNKARDIYDVGFLLQHYKNKFSLEQYRNLSDIMERRDIDTLSHELKIAKHEGIISGLSKDIDPDKYALHIDDLVNKGIDRITKSKEYSR